MSNEAHPKEYAVRLRWRDLDYQGHVYHGTYLTLLDEARTEFFRELGIGNPGAYVLARIELDYVKELTVDPPEAQVAFEILRIGNSSLQLTESIRAAGEIRATARTVVVLWEKDAHRSRALTEAERSRVEVLFYGASGKGSD